MSEDFFWQATPRKIITLIENYKKIKKENYKSLAIYVASFVWGKNPDEEEQEVLGIDQPVDPALLRGFY